MSDQENSELDEELQKDLEELKPGSSLKVEKDGQEVTYHKAVVTPVCEKHNYQHAGFTLDGFEEVQCKCGTGRILDSKVNKLKNGEIVHL